MKLRRAPAFLISLLVLAGTGPAFGAAPADLTAGVVVHLDCGDAAKTARLLRGDGFVVHGVDTDAGNVAKARERMARAGLYGRVAIDRYDGRHLPYVDNMVNRLVADGPVKVADAEVLRVLVPGGVAELAGRTLTKPRPATIDEWTHYLHGPDNNAVAADTVLGPPRRLQWQCGPKWTRHHDRMSSISAVVTSGGRVFCILDEGSTASIYLPSRWALIARDAFNGKLLWRREIPTWYTRFKGLKDGPADAPRRLVAAEGKVYATLDLHGPLTCLDAATGKTVRTYAGTKGAEEVILSDGVLFVLIGPGSIGDGGRLQRPAEKRTVVALQAESGRRLWQASDVVAALTMAADAERLCYFNFASGSVVCLDRKTGKSRWASDALPAPAKQTSFFASKLVLADNVVLLASGELSGMTKSGGGETRSDTLTALDAATGKTIWTAKHPPSGYSSPENLFVIGQTVWCDNSSNGRSDGTVVGLDLKTGRETRRFACDQKNYWFHHRCYAGRASSNYIMTSRTGIEFIDLRTQRWDLNHWTRGACVYGIMPANGLVYTPPAPCICYAETYLHSFNAFAPAGATAPARPTGPRLERGPAYSGIPNAKPQNAEGTADWPTYRGGNARNGLAACSVPARLKPGWRTAIGGRLSSVTVADGKLFVAAVDRHAVHALSAATGRRVWQYTAGGRVDSPPTVWRGRVLFGSADGWVYCLRAADGELAWRFRAAPADRRILSYEQVESLWPVHGNVMVEDGIAHFVAGRSIFVDGGMRYCRLDAATGKLLSETVLDERDPQTGRNVQERIKWLNMPVGRPDILSCDGDRVYMRSQAFDLKGKRLAMGPTDSGPTEGRNQGGAGTHLFCPTGFLDDTWFHRTYWLYGRTWGSGWSGYYVAGKFAPAGRIMCVGPERVYAFGRRPQYYRWTLPMEFRLFAASKEWKASATAAPAARRGAAKAKTAKKKKRKNAPGPVSNQANYAWTTTMPILVRAMTLAPSSRAGAPKTLFLAGPRDVLDESARGRSLAGGEKLYLKQEAAMLGKDGAVLWAVSAGDGMKLAEYKLPAPPVFDGMAAAAGRLYLATIDGAVQCWSGR